jgi:hypothetical protein
MTIMTITTEPTVRDYVPRPACQKTESENEFTLRSRKYVNVRSKYYRAHAAEIRERTRLRYRDDPVYRERCIARSKASVCRRRERLLLSNPGPAVV